MARTLTASVTDSGGRTVVVYPDTQMVWSMLAWVTRGSIAPGVSDGSGSAMALEVPVVAVVVATVPVVVDVAEVAVLEASGGATGRSAGAGAAAEQAEISST